MPYKQEIVYEVGSFRVSQWEFSVEGYVCIRVSRVNPQHQELAVWMSLIRPRTWPWPFDEIGLLRGLFRSGQSVDWWVLTTHCLPYEEALDRAMACAEELAVKDDVRFLSERVEQKLLEVKLRQQAADEIEAEAVQSQITDTTRESE